MSQVDSNIWHYSYHFILILLVYFSLFIIALHNIVVYVDYKSFVKQVLGVTHVETCPPNCTFNLTAQWRDPWTVIFIDNPSGTPVLLKLNTTQRKVWIATNRTTHIDVAFDGGLYIDVYPLYPLSDAEPRSAYLPSSGNLTIRIAPPAIGGTLQFILTTIGGLLGLLTTLGIIKHATKTPAVNNFGSTFPEYKYIIYNFCSFRFFGFYFQFSLCLIYLPF